MNKIIDLSKKEEEMVSGGTRELYKYELSWGEYYLVQETHCKDMAETILGVNEPSERRGVIILVVGVVLGFFSAYIIDYLSRRSLYQLPGEKTHAP